MQVRSTNYYADQIAARYPLLDPKGVRALCQWMMRRLYTLMVQGEEVLIQSNAHPVRLKIYHRDFNVDRANERNRHRLHAIQQQRQERLARQRQQRYRAHFGLPRRGAPSPDSE